MRVEVCRDELPVVDAVPSDLFVRGLREFRLRVAPVEVRDVLAFEAVLGDFPWDRDRVSTVDTFPCEGTQKEIVAQL